MYKNIHLYSFFCVIFLFIGNLAFGQSGNIVGAVIETETGEPIIGAKVVIIELQKSATADLNGNFKFNEVPIGKYTISATFFGYLKKNITEVQVTNKGITTLNISLDFETAETETVVITAEAVKETSEALLIIRANAEQISDGIAADAIRRSPDNTTSDVMKRIPGASIQEGKFAIIRGLNERYNSGFVNGAPLPSTETDKRAISFDLFPSNVLDNITILKTATPDQPADFAGGIIQINTKEIPTSDFFDIGVGVGINTLANFNQFKSFDQGSLPVLGLTGGELSLNENIPSINSYPTLNNSERAEASKNFLNNYGTETQGSSPPSHSIQLAGGKAIKIKENAEFGLVLSLSNSNSYKFTEIERREYVNLDNNVPRKFENDSQYSREVFTSGMLNLGFKLPNNKFFLKNLFSINSDFQYIDRYGYSNLDQLSDTSYERKYAYYALENRMLTSQLGAEHSFGKTNQYKVSWVAGYSDINRELPDYRLVYYNNQNARRPFFYGTSLQANPKDNSRFFYELNENLFSGDYKFDFPIFLKKDIIKINGKVGGMHVNRERIFDARVFGTQGIGITLDQRLQTPDILLDPNNYNNNFFFTDASRRSDSYEAGSDLNSGFAMFDATIYKNLRFVGGARVESYTQRLNSFGTAGDEIKIDTNVTDLLPSANLTYSLSDKNKVRFAYSKTLSRPEFRELAPFAFYDYQLDAVVGGNAGIVRTTINNLDLRFERYPGADQILSASVFYKEFTNPIEFINEPQGNNQRQYGFANVAKATNYGVEVEFRKRLDFIDEWLKTKFFSYATILGNFAIIESEVDLSETPGAYFGDNAVRTLQGQSPFIINGGVFVTTQNLYNFSLLVNRVGRRIAFTGNFGNADIFENPRTVLDFQVSKTIKNVFTAKLNFSDLLAQDLIFYQDMNDNGKFDGKVDQNFLIDNKFQNDNQIYRFNYARRISLSFVYKF
jgi:outer membrane receptor protein involved in Fe transport